MNEKDEKNGGSAGHNGTRRMLFSSDLFRGSREIVIEHCGQHYRLQITKAGKLILNK
jgi:hemin uptake protein HemP